MSRPMIGNMSRYPIWQIPYDGLYKNDILNRART